MNSIGGLVSQLGGGQPSPEQAESQFDQISKMLPSGALASGLAAAFKADNTPPFAQLAAQLFGNSGATQKAGMLNMLLSALGPGLLSGVAGGFLGKFLGGGKTQVTPEEAEQVPPDVVQQVAAEAEKQDSSIMDKLGQLYAEHPGVVKSLGGAVLAVALGKAMTGQK
jgi:hypothetical protein